VRNCCEGKEMDALGRAKRIWPKLEPRSPFRLRRQAAGSRTARSQEGNHSPPLPHPRSPLFIRPAITSPTTSPAR